MGPVWWKKCSSLLILPMIKSDHMIFFGFLFPLSFFHRLKKWLKTFLYETSEALYNDIWVIDWAATNHEAYTRWLLWYGTQLGHVHHPCID